MKIKKNVLCCLITMLAVAANFFAQAQQKSDATAAAVTKPISVSNAPKSIVRTISQDKKGSIWIASWEGIFKYDGKTFTNITSKVSSARFFTLLQDKHGNFWFGSIGSGVYYYDGKSFKNFTTKQGLAGNAVTAIYEDKMGTVWFGTEAGVSSYDGKSFKNLKLNEAPPVTGSDSINVSVYQNELSKEHWMHNDVASIIEDKSGKLWFGTRGSLSVYDGKTFTAVTNAGKPFTNVRSMIKDKNGNIWLGGNDGLWYYNGSTFTNFTQKFVGYIKEDKKGNIWTGSESKHDKSWALAYYNVKSLNDKEPVITEIINKPIIFGILEDDKGNIWFGDFNGVHRYDGKTITDFKNKTGQP